jgi:hypothetical protein
MLNGFAFALLLTSLFVLRFRGWKRPLMVVFYFVFFAALEMAVSHFALPPGAMGPEVAWVCIGLTLPVWVAIVLLYRHERANWIED